jgi:hypothetical protein
MPAVTPEDHVSLDWLKDLFSRAYFKASIDGDGDLYLTDGLDFPIWVTLDEEHKLIWFFTYMRRDLKDYAARMVRPEWLRPQCREGRTLGWDLSNEVPRTGPPDHGEAKLRLSFSPSVQQSTGPSQGPHMAACS